MKRAGAWLLASGLALFAGSGAVAADISGRAIDAQTSEPIAHARITVHVNAPGNPYADLVLLTDAAGAFAASNLPEGTAQFSGEKAGYVSASLSQVPLSDKSAQQPSLALRLTRQAVIEGTVVDENNVGLPSTWVQLFQYRVFDGWRRLQASAGTQTDEMGGFRVSGLPPGRYYLGTTARFERLRNPKKLVYVPTLYPDATDVSAALPIDLQPGSDDHIKVRLRAVVSHQVRGRVMTAGRPNVSLRAPDLDRFPLSVLVSLDSDEKTGTFTIRDAPPGRYVLEAGTELDGRHLRAARTITVADSDLDGILIEPRAMPEVTGRVFLDGKAVSPGVAWSVTLQSPQRTAGAKIDDDGSFRATNVEPGTYRVFVPNAASYYVQSMQQGSRDVRRDGITVGDSTPDPIEIQLRSQAATINGLVAGPGPDHQAAVIVGLFWQIDEELVLEKQVVVGGFVMSLNGNPPVVVPGGSLNGMARFTLQGVAPGEHVLLAWPSDEQIEYSAPGFAQHYAASGQTIRVTEGAHVSAVVDHLLTKRE
jgi:hypothetical protein